MSSTDLTPTTTFGVVVSVAGTVCGIAYQGEIFEAADTMDVGPAVGDTVLADYLPATMQWIIVAIVV